DQSRLFGRGVEIAECAAGGVGDDLARGRQRDARAAHEQRHAKTPFDLCEAHAELRLTHRKRLGGVAEVQLAGEGIDQFEIAGADAHMKFRMTRLGYSAFRKDCPGLASLPESAKNRAGRDAMNDQSKIEAAKGFPLPSSLE